MGQAAKGKASLGNGGLPQLGTSPMQPMQPLGLMGAPFGMPLMPPFMPLGMPMGLPTPLLSPKLPAAVAVAGGGAAPKRPSASQVPPLPAKSASLLAHYKTQECKAPSVYRREGVQGPKPGGSSGSKRGRGRVHTLHSIDDIASLPHDLMMKVSMLMLSNMNREERCLSKVGSTAHRVNIAPAGAPTPSTLNPLIHCTLPCCYRTLWLPAAWPCPSSRGPAPRAASRTQANTKQLCMGNPLLRKPPQMRGPTAVGGGSGGRGSSGILLRSSRRGISREPKQALAHLR